MSNKQTMIALDPNKSTVFGTQKKKKHTPTTTCKVLGCNNHIHNGQVEVHKRYAKNTKKHFVNLKGLLD